jgi:hypothetical protein
MYWLRVSSAVLQKGHLCVQEVAFPAYDTEVAEVILYTKFKHWAYEQEVRTYLTLEDQENGLFFKDFGSDLKPFTVIAGPRCETTMEEIVQALGPFEKGSQLIKARAGFKRFEIVKDRRGFQNT